MNSAPEPHAAAHAEQGPHKLDGLIVTPLGAITGTIEFGANITSIRPDNRVSAANTIIPGFIDVQVNGAGGYDCVHAPPGAFKTIADVKAALGTTTLLATLITATREDAFQALRNFEHYVRAPSTAGSDIVGVHLEGPFLNPAKAGAHPQRMIAPDIDYLEQALALAPIKMMTIAPELPNAESVIRFAVAHGVRVQLGHSNATYVQAQAAFAWGATGVSHLFNAMSPLQHREPGLAGAALESAPYAQLILDFLHVHKAAVRIALKCIPNLYFVSDATAACGMPDGRYPLGETEIIKANGRLSSADGSLAGADLTMAIVFRNLISMGLPLTEACLRTSTLPAQHLGLTDRGALESGKRADVVVLDQNHHVQHVFANGAQVR